MCNKDPLKSSLQALSDQAGNDTRSLNESPMEGY